jgi:hypothetical protein
MAALIPITAASLLFIVHTHPASPLSAKKKMGGRRSNDFSKVGATRPPSPIPGGENRQLLKVYRVDHY